MRGSSTFRIPMDGGAAQLAPSLFAFDLEPAAATRGRPMPADLAPESGVDGDEFALSGARAVQRELRKGSTKFSRRSMSSTMSKSVRQRIQRGKTNHRAYVRKLARVALETVALLPHIVAAAESAAIAAEADAVLAVATRQALADKTKRTSKLGFLRSKSLLDTSRASFVAREALSELAAKQTVLNSAADTAVNVARSAALAAADAVVLPPHAIMANLAAEAAAAAAGAGLLSAASAVKAIDYAVFAMEKRGEEERRRSKVRNAESLRRQDRSQRKRVAVRGEAPPPPSSLVVDRAGSTVHESEARPRADLWVSDANATAVRMAEMDATSAILQRERNVQMFGALMSKLERCMHDLHQRDRAGARECARLRRWYHWHLAEGLRGLEKYGIDAGMAALHRRAAGSASDAGKKKTRRGISRNISQLELGLEDDPDIDLPIPGQPEPESGLPAGMSGVQAETQLKPLFALLRGCGGAHGVALVEAILTSKEEWTHATLTTEPKWVSIWSALFELRERTAKLAREITVSSICVVEAIGAWRDLLAADARLTGQTHVRARTFAWRDDASYIQRMKRQMPGIIIAVGEHAESTAGSPRSPRSHPGQTNYKKYNPQPLIQQWFKIRRNAWSDWGPLLLAPKNTSPTGRGLSRSKTSPRLGGKSRMHAALRKRADGEAALRKKLGKKEKKGTLGPEQGADGAVLSKMLLLAKLRKPVSALFSELTAEMEARAEDAMLAVSDDDFLVQRSAVENAQEAARAPLQRGVSFDAKRAFVGASKLDPDTLRLGLIGTQQRRMLLSLGGVVPARMRRSGSAAALTAAPPPTLRVRRRVKPTLGKTVSAPRIMRMENLVELTPEETAVLRDRSARRIQGAVRSSKARFLFKEIAWEIATSIRMERFAELSAAATIIQSGGRVFAARHGVMRLRSVRAVTKRNEEVRLVRAIERAHCERAMRRKKKREIRLVNRKRRASVAALQSNWRGAIGRKASLNMKSGQVKRRGEARARRHSISLRGVAGQAARRDTLLRGLVGGNLWGDAQLLAIKKNLAVRMARAAAVRRQIWSAQRLVRCRFHTAYTRRPCPLLLRPPQQNHALAVAASAEKAHRHVVHVFSVGGGAVGIRARKKLQTESATKIQAHVRRKQANAEPTAPAPVQEQKKAPAKRRRRRSSVRRRTASRNHGAEVKKALMKPVQETELVEREQLKGTVHELKL